jgi:hypothetical protein
MPNHTKMTAEEREAYRKAIADYTIDSVHGGQEHWKHWRAWGSWFSWGSPTGLGLFFIAIAIAIWIICQAF